MNRVFADTSYWIAVVDSRDAHSVAAHGWSAENPNVEIVTSEFVFLELLNAMGSFGQRFRSGAVHLLRSAETNPRVRLVVYSHEIWSRAVDLYAARADKRWSLTDCTSFLIMQEHGIREALTSDSDFEQAGFVALLRSR